MLALISSTGESDMEDKEKQIPSEDQSFEKMLEAYEQKEAREIQVGDRVSCKVLSIGRESVFVDIGAIIDGVVEKAELLDEDGKLTCKEGDVLDLYVVSVGESEVRLSRAMSGTGGLRALEDAFENEVPVEGRVTGRCKGGYDVTVMQKRAFCPGSQMDLKYAEDPEQYVGKTFRFLLTQFEQDGRNIVLSRRRLLEKELEKMRGEFLSKIEKDMVIEGTVTRLVSFGAFVEVFPGIEGLVHVSELSWSRVSNPEKILHIGQNVKVKILAVERDKGNGKVKISLSIKDVSPDPWENIGAFVREGQVVDGEVTRCVSFGAFVEVVPGVEGLVHISEMSYIKRVLKPEELVKVGDRVRVMVKEIDKENRRLSLSMKDVEGDPWSDILQRYHEGEVVEGRLEKKEKFGFFVSIEPGVTGLVPRVKLEGSPYGAELEKLKEGNVLRVTIESINQAEKKMTLAPAPGGEEGDWESYSPSDSSFGSLGEKLRQAMDKKKRET